MDEADRLPGEGESAYHKRVIGPALVEGFKLGMEHNDRAAAFAEAIKDTPNRIAEAAEWDAAGVEQADAEELCELSEMTIRSCVHCRDTGRYSPPQGSGTSALSTRGTEYVTDTTQITMDDVMESMRQAGMRFVDPEEAFRRGRFGKGGADRQDNR